MRSLKNINEDYTKTKTKIAVLNDKLKKLEQEKTAAENAEIVAAIRGGKMNERELADFLRDFKNGGQNQIKPHKREEFNQ